MSKVAGVIAFVATLLIAVVLLSPLPQMPGVGLQGSFAIRDVAIIDVESGTLLSNRFVTVVDGRIETVSLSKPPTTRETFIEINGTGKFLLPGLWDMHTHTTKLAAQHQHPLFIANGVTGVRDLWGCMSESDPFFACIEDRERWNRAVNQNTGISPRYIGHSSFQINDGSEVPAGFPEFFRARDENEARQLVRFYAESGADILKTYTELAPATYHVLADEARIQGLSLQGHRPIKVSLAQAINAGQRSIEHGRLFLLECYTGADEYRALDKPLSAYTSALRAKLVDQHDEAHCQTLVDQLAQSDTWWTPTLLTLQMGARAADPGFRDDPRLKYIPYLFKNLMWMPDADRMAGSSLDRSGRNTHAAMYDMALEHVRQAHTAGVKLLLGTDVFDTYVFPGFSVHDELAAMVLAGLSPADALKIATIDAATFSGVNQKFGSIAPGKAADMILLNANPLLDIQHTRQIDGLFLNGVFYDRLSLDRLLQFAEQRAGSIQHNLQIFWSAIRSPILRVQFAD